MRFLGKLLVLAFVMPVLFTSCSSSDDGAEDTKEPERPEDNLPAGAKAFVGFWDNQTYSGSDFIFFGDGACWMLWKRDNGRYEKSGGSWTYDDATKILATTTGNWQWQVTLSNDENWAGISLSGNKVQTYKKITDKSRYFRVLLESSKWAESPDSTLSIGYYGKYFGSRYGYSISSTMNIGSSSSMYLEIEDVDTNPDDFVFQYELLELRTSNPL